MNESKLYKYWFFYIKPEYLHLVYTETDDSLLYAYTDNKEYAKLFQSQRDMNKFFIKKRKIEKEEVSYLAREFTREYLIKKEVKTKIRGIGSEVIDYDLVLTSTENYMVESSLNKILMVDIWTKAWINPYIFNHEYFTMLKKIGLVEKFDTISNWKSSSKVVNRIGENIQPDYLSAFIHIYQFLISPEKGGK